MAIRPAEDIRNFIKGKIAEIIFEELFREGSNFEVIPFGYEKNFPELAQYQEFVHVRKVLKVVRRMPDFMLISADKTEVFLVEVKYCTKYDEDQIHRMAEETVKYWDHSWLFVATPQNFFFSPCNDIKRNNGKMNFLSRNWIKSDKTYDKFLCLLRDFEK